MPDFLRREDVLRENGLPLAVIRRDPQPPYPLHAHEFAELVIVYRGEGIHFTESGECRIAAGNVFLIHGAYRHGYRQPDDLALVNLIFRPEDIVGLGIFPLMRQGLPLPSSASPSAASEPCRLAPQELAETMRQIAQMEQEEHSPQPIGSAMMTALFLELVVMLLRRQLPEAAAPAPSPRLQPVMRYLENHYQEAVTLEQLARLSRLSTSSLTREFKRTTGFSPVEYLINYRIRQAARRLLAVPEESIAETGYACGFADSNYFTRVFRQKTGRSPREFKKTGTWAG